MVQRRFEIVNGDGLHILLFSLGEGNPTPRKCVKFKAKIGMISSSPSRKGVEWPTETEVNIRITGLDQEDGSGERWIFRGYNDTLALTRGRVQGFYDSRTRTGWFEYV